MNMWRLLSSILLMDLILGNGLNSKEKKVRKNLIQIQIQVHKVQGQYQYHHIDRIRNRLSQPEEDNIITYDLDVLKEIKHVIKRDNRYKELPFRTVRAVRELILNRRKRGSRGGINNPIAPEKPNGLVKKSLRTVPYASNK